MNKALIQANEAYMIAEVPIGAVIVKEDRVLCEAYNLRETTGIATAHAELLAIESACRILQSWRLSECELYVTLEPCPMCMGAIINSRIDRVFFGARDPKAGACGSVVDLNQAGFNHKSEITGGILSQQCGEILTRFFRERR